MKYFSLAKTVLLVFSCFATLLAQAQADPVPGIESGSIDLRDWNVKERKVALAGNWHFFENELIVDPRQTGTPTRFPEVLSKAGFEMVQFGTYSTQVLLPRNAGTLAFEIPQLYSSYKLFVNGKLVARNGEPGTSRETTTPQWMPQIAPFEFTGDTLRITLQVANFYHYHTGAKQPIYLGSASLLRAQDILATNSNLTECLTLLVLGFAFFIIYYVRQEKKKITLYFSLLCISWAIRSVFSNNYVIVDFIPEIDWTWMVRIEYITLYSMLIWTVLFFSRLFPKESSKLIKYIFVIVNGTFIVETLVTPPVFFTKWIALYLIIAALVLIHSGVITIRALIKERAGVWYLVFSLVLALILFSYDMIVFEGYIQYYNSVLFSVGYLIIFVLMGITLLYHLKIFKGDGGSGTLTFDDLYNAGGSRDDA